MNVALDLFSVEGAGIPPAPFVVVELPGAPRGKGRPRGRIIHSRSGPPFVSFYTDAKTRAYEEALAWQAKAAMRGKKPITGAVAIRVIAKMPIPSSWPKWKRLAAAAGRIYPITKPDDDNLRKSLDAFNGYVWIDDAQVVRSLTIKEYSEQPGLLVEVYELPIPAIPTR